MKKIYGPYVRKDGRKHVILKDGKTTTSMSYPKYLLENSLGRSLVGDETADHKDEDFRNDSLSNLQVLSRGDNVRKSNVFRGVAAEVMSFVCPECGVSFERSARDYRHNQGDQQKAGPFCGKPCAGKYGARIGWLKPR